MNQIPGNEIIFQDILNFLIKYEIDFELSFHEPTITSEDSARIRNVELSTGAKALLCDVDNNILQFVIPGDRRLDKSKIRQILDLKNFEFMDLSKVYEKYKLVKGSVPPLGFLFNVDTYYDLSFLDKFEINFNIAYINRSIKIKSVEKYLNILKSQKVRFYNISIDNNKLK